MLSFFVLSQLVIRTHRAWTVASQFLHPNRVPALTPVESADPKNTPVTPLQSADPKTQHLKSFRIRTYKKRRGEGAAVGFFAVADGHDFNGVIAFQIEENPVVAATQTEAGKRRLQSFYVARAAREVAIEAVENLDGGFSVDGAG